MRDDDRIEGKLEDARGSGVLPLVTVAAGVTVLRRPLVAVLSGPAPQTWVTIVVSVTIQALPFLVLGVLLSSAIAAFVPQGRLANALPRRTLLAVPAAGLAGIALPGCECSSVVVAGRLASGGVPPGPAVAFLLAAPAVNPVVLVATAVAFPGRPSVVLARFTASLLTAVTVGVVWGRLAPASWTACTRGSVPLVVDRRLAVFRRTLVEDALHSSGFLAIGAVATGTLQVAFRGRLPGAAESSGLEGVAVLAILAVVLCVCSEADAFVAASLSQFSMTARLAFMVVGPAVDLKLIALHAATFGPRSVVRFAPLALGTAVLAAVAVGALVR